MSPIYKKQLENLFEINIFNFSHLSGNYKASFGIISYSEKLERNIAINIVVKQSETYKKAIQRTLHNK